MKKDVYIYDTTLRDGEQAEGVSFSLEDKIHIALKLDEFGVDYIEGGWPGSNPKAVAFFNEMKKHELKHAKLSAFGSTRRANSKAEDDPNIKALIEVETPAVAIFGKSWDFHVTDALRVSLEENLEMIKDSVSYLKSKGKEVLYDAEHFFDGYKKNPEYALKTIKTAEEAGADTIVLCDTNGGTMPDEVAEIVKVVRQNIKAQIGIHAHNDAGTAVSNSFFAVLNGAEHIQGTINGYGERTGNANLCTIIPNLILKYKKKCLPEDKLVMLTAVSRFVDEMANIAPNSRQPFVGNSVFAHKGGIHVSAVQRNSETYEHIKPELVGNERRILVSELSGKSNILWKAKEFGLDVENVNEESKKIVDQIKELENKGFHFEAAEASFELLIKKAIKKHRKFFDLKGFRVIVEKRSADEECISEATIKLEIDGQTLHTCAEGDGPVNALDGALRKSLREIYPIIKDVHLTDYKVRVLDDNVDTSAKVRVLIESSDGVNVWSTIGVSENIIEASWQALVDSIEYKLLKEEQK